MNYQKLNKAQLIARIEELEKQTIDYKLTQAKEELVALGRDIAWVANRTFELGQKAAVQIEDALERMEKPRLLPTEVVTESITPDAFTELDGLLVEIRTQTAPMEYPY